MTQETLAERRFTPADQQRFAALSGDRNPIHLDPVFARRTEMGAPIVHGIHTLLWVMEELFKREPLPLGNIEAEFLAPVYVGDTVRALLSERSSSNVGVTLCVDRAPVTKVSLHARRRWQTALHRQSRPHENDWPSAPIALDFDAISGRAAAFPLPERSSSVEAALPFTCSRLSQRTVISLCATSRLVGMACPGLHSLLKGIDVDLIEPFPEKSFVFATQDANKRFRLVRMSIGAPGLFGTVSAFARRPPAVQPRLREIGACVPRNAFAGASVLIVGGSRGLGEVIAKTCAAGGARIALTYLAGRCEAEAIKREILDYGGLCEIFPFDVRADIPAQLAEIKLDATHLYYCASPPILRRSSLLAAPPDYFQFFAAAFLGICNALLARRNDDNLRAFYPSSLVLDTPGSGSAELAMAKAAGETLCYHMNRFLPGIEVYCRRLPRLCTDQSATAIPVRAEPVLDVALPFVCEMHGVTGQSVGTPSKDRPALHRRPATAGCRDDEPTTHGPSCQK